MNTILTVDDDPLIHKVLTYSLQEQGCQFLNALNGHIGLQMLREHTVDTVICDLMMPGMSGLQFLEHMRQMHPDLPVIILTAADDLNSAVEAMKAGAFDFLTKPFNQESLAMTVNRALKHHKLQKRNLALEKENLEYKKRLEVMVFEKTAELQRQSEHLSKLNRSLKQTHMEIVKVLAELLAIKDPFRETHYARVNEYALAMGQKMGLDETEIEHLSFVAYLHDLGELFVDNSILNKQSRLNSEEYKIIRRHPILTVRILDKIPFFNAILPAIRAHHEWYNGTGYPDGLKGEDIPLLARITHIADAFVAMTSDRAYRKAFSTQQAISTLNKNRGTQFDPELTVMFMNVLNIYEKQEPQK